MKNLIEFQRKKTRKSQSLMDNTMKLADMQRDIKVIEKDIETKKNDIANSVKDIAQKEQDKTRICAENESLKQQIEDKNKLTEEIAKSTADINNYIESIQKKKSDISTSLQNIQNSNKDLTDKLLNLQQELSRLENRREKLNNDIENIIGRLWEDYELTYNSACEIKTEVENEKESFARLSELKSQIKSLGSVNVDSIEEYKAVEERFVFLTEQKSDL